MAFPKKKPSNKMPGGGMIGGPPAPPMQAGASNVLNSLMPSQPGPGLPPMRPTPDIKKPRFKVKPTK